MYILLEFLQKRAIPSTAHTQSNTEAIMCVPQIVTYVVREKGMENKGKRW